MTQLPYYDTIQVAVLREPADPQQVVVVESIRGGGSGDNGYPPTVYHLTAVSSWNQVHVYSYLPEVRLIDETGVGVEIAVEYPDAAHVYIEFPLPFTGTVILS